MNDADLLRTLEAQSVEITKNVSPENPSGQQNFSSVGTSVGTPKSRPAKLTSPNETFTVQGRAAQLSDSQPKVFTEQGPTPNAEPAPSPTTQRFSYYPCELYEAGDPCPIPNYRLAENCTTCVYSQFDFVKHKATCAHWGCCTVAGYVCDQYKSPASLGASSKLSDSALADSSLPAQEPPASHGRFRDAELYTAALAQVQELGEQKNALRTAAALLHFYKKAFAEKYGANANPFTAAA